MSNSPKEIVTKEFVEAFTKRNAFGGDSTEFAEAWVKVRDAVTETGLGGTLLVQALEDAERAVDSLRVIREE